MVDRYVEEESYLDMATAISGSGPAYILMVIEVRSVIAEAHASSSSSLSLSAYPCDDCVLCGQALIDSGVHMGFPRVMAERVRTLALTSSPSLES